MIVTLPYPTGVNVNHSYVGMGKGRHLSDAASTWRDEVRLIVRQDQHAPLIPPLALHVAVYPPRDKVRRDLDGILKQTIDAIFLELGIDDTMENLPRIFLIARVPAAKPCLIVGLVHCDWQKADIVQEAFEERT